ncbi:hypothetical protein AB0N05_11280 [Nocardia sp. NPDC051030]|uniref:hypothetical protein n=1 Tax=Nocardia sp. NPDC051030 TaxID=3155162 RepID=UPI003435E780
MYRDFVVPDEDEFMQELGIELMAADSAGSETVRLVRLDLGSDDHVVFSFDVMGMSVRFRRVTRGTVVTDIFREAATRLSIGWVGESRRFVTEFNTDSLAGRLEITVGESVDILDQMLFV